MHFHEDELEIIKDLICEQQKNPTQETFSMILQRVDQFISETIVMFSRIYYFEESMPQLLQDLYQTAIVGLGDAIKRFDPNQPPKVIPNWILVCTRNELFRMYRVRNFDPERYLYEHPDCEEENEADSNLLQEDIQRIIKNLTESGKLTQEDYHLLEVFYIQNMSIGKILRIFGDRWGKRRNLVKREIKRVAAIVKREFIKRGLGEV